MGFPYAKAFNLFAPNQHKGSQKSNSFTAFELIIVFVESFLDLFVNWSELTTYLKVIFCLNGAPVKRDWWQLHYINAPISLY